MRELTLPAPLVLLSGMSDAGTLLKPQHDAFGEALHTPAWIAHRDGENLASYARRWAEKINELVRGFDPERPWFFGGMSMGGMVALEMLPHLHRPPAAVFLIASARSTPRLTWPVKAGAMVSGKLSSNWVGRLTTALAVPFGFRDGQDDVGFRLLKRMTRQADPAFIRWAVGATTEWTYTGPGGGADTPPIFQIHGRHDWLLPLREEESQVVIDTGRHLINLSHPHTVNRWLFDHILRLTRGAIELASPRMEDAIHRGTSHKQPA